MEKTSEVAPSALGASVLEVCKLLLMWKLVKITANGEALAKKGHLEHKCSALAPRFHSSTKVEFTTSSPFFANAMLVAGVFNDKTLWVEYN